MRHRYWTQATGVLPVLPEHGLEDRLQRDLEVQLICTRELHVDGLVPGDDVPCVVYALNPHGVFIHDVRPV